MTRLSSPFFCHFPIHLSLSFRPSDYPDAPLKGPDPGHGPVVSLQTAPLLLLEVDHDGLRRVRAAVVLLLLLVLVLIDRGLVVLVRLLLLEMLLVMLLLLLMLLFYLLLGL